VADDDLESALLAGSGCLCGTLLRLCGPQLQDRPTNVLNFPVVYSAAPAAVALED
jgi:hypothetical protein